MPGTRSLRVRSFRFAIYGLVATGGVFIVASQLLAQSGTRPGGSGTRQSGGGAQGSGTQGGTQRGGTTLQDRGTAQPTFEQRFWDYLQKAKYQNWAPLSGMSADFYPGQSPHGEFLKLYANRPAAAAPQELPRGSILIKENYGPDRQSPMAITVMYRVEGYDPQHHDWYWVKYDPDGRVAEKSEMRLAGQVDTCIGCHSGAAGDDFVFAND